MNVNLLNKELPLLDIPFKYIQDGPSLESSSYLNLSLRYFGPWVPGTLGPLELWNPWTLGLLDLFPPTTAPHTSPYIHLPPPILLLWYGLVMGGGEL